MISITDTRQNDNMKELKDLWPGDFFMYENGQLYRRIDTGNYLIAEDIFEIIDCIPVMCMKSGSIVDLHRESIVEYIPDNQIEIIIED